MLEMPALLSSIDHRVELSGSHLALRASDDIVAIAIKLMRTNSSPLPIGTSAANSIKFITDAAKTTLPLVTTRPGSFGKSTVAAIVNPISQKLYSVGQAAGDLGVAVTSPFGYGIYKEATPPSKPEDGKIIQGKDGFTLFDLFNNFSKWTDAIKNTPAPNASKNRTTSTK